MLNLFPIGLSGNEFLYIGCSSVIGYLIYWYYNTFYYPRFLGPLKDIPGPSNLLWLDIQTIYYVITGDPGYFLKSLHEKYGPIVHTGLRVISVVEPSATKQIYSSYKFPKHDKYQFAKVAVENLISIRDKNFHSKRKRHIAPALNLKTLLSMESLIQNHLITNFSSVINQAIDNNSGYIDLYDLYHKAILDAFTELCFGKSSKSLNQPDFPVHELPKEITKAVGLKVSLPFFSFLENKPHPWISTTLTEVLEKRRNGYKRNDVLQILVDSIDSETGEILSDEEILEEMIILLLAGVETTSIALVWTTYLIFKHPKVHQKLVDELLLHFPNKDQPINYQDCHNLPYLNAVLLETLRLFPPIGVILPRVVPEGGATLCGYYIPEGTCVGTGSFVFHHIEKYWPECESFKPERWLGPEGEKLKNQHFVFSFGPRGCIGKTFSWFEMYIVLSNLFRNFEFEIDPNMSLTQQQYLTNKPVEEKLVVKASKRTM